MPTKIEWTDEVWNPVTGCTKVSAGCANCYAERMFDRNLWTDKYRFGRTRQFADVQCHPRRLDQPLHWRKSRRVFCCSMGDLFHEAVPDDFIGAVFTAMCESPQHTYQILTKRPERMKERIEDLIAKPPRIWLGVSVENQETADERIPLLLKTPAAVRFVSVEPMLGPVDIGRFLISKKVREEYQFLIDGFPEEAFPLPRHLQIRNSLDWVICGGESGPKARPCDLAWLRSIVEQCKSANVPCFVKQVHVNGKLSRNPEEWPEDLRVREFPK